MRALVWLGLAACGARATTTTTTTTATTSSSAPPVDACQRGLAALAAGDLVRWRGGAGCTRGDVERVLGRPTRSGPGFEEFPPQRATAQVIDVILAPGDDALIAIAIGAPRLVRPWRDVLGPPEAQEPSHHFDDAVQYVYPSRGIAVHEVRSGELIGVVGFAPMTLEAFDASELPLAFNAVEDPVR